MKTIQFKTSINCSSCVSKVTPILDNNEAIINWNVATTDPDKILTITTTGIDEDDLIHSLKKAGYNAEKVSL